MAKGRKSIPSRVIEITGGVARTHRPPRDKEPTPPEKMPRCPNHLDKEAKKEWRRAGKILKDIGLMTDLDMMILAAYCEAYSRWITALNIKQILETISKTPEINLKGYDHRLIEYQSLHTTWETAKENLLSKGLVYKKANNDPGLNPYLKIEHDSSARMSGIRKSIEKNADVAYDQVLKAGIQIGMSPSSRVNLKVTPKKDDDEEEAFRNRKKGGRG